MTIGTSLVLIASGAILRWAVTAHASWIDLRLAGLVLFVVGLVALALACLYTFKWSGPSRANAPPPPAV